MKYQLKTRQICLFFIAFMPVGKFFILPSILAKNANEDMWISVLISILLDFATLSAILFTCQKTKTDFYGLLKLNFGTVGTKIILGFYLVFFLFKAIIPINEQQNYIELTLYETMPNLLDFTPFFLVAFFLCLKKIRIGGRCADIIWIISSIGITMLFALCISNCDFGAILPIGANGFTKILKGSYSSGIWFGDCVYVLFFIGQFECKNKDAIKILTSYLIAAAVVIVFMILFYCIFTSVAHRQIFALTETFKFSTVINNIGRFDYIGIICVLFSGVFSLVLPLYFATEILKKICDFKRVWIPALIINAAMLLIIVFLREYFSGITRFLLRYGNAFFIFFSNILPLFTIFLRKERKYETA